ncbi:hypothetical protein [Methylobacillus sp.]|uniref:hypothetical protein n=1 Tax=Methylobacillus sp. TaxID=56818 RepID=UPI002FE0E392
MAAPTKQEAMTYEPVTFWLADPRNNVRIAVPERRGEWIVFHNGHYTAQTQDEYDAIQSAIGYKVWEQNRNKAPKPHPISGYAPLSDEAYEAHVELVTTVHG